MSDAVLHNLTVCRALGAAASASARAGEDAEEQLSKAEAACHCGSTRSPHGHAAY